MPKVPNSAKWSKDMETVIRSVRDERLNQLLKFGPQNHDDGVWLKILVEEVGEVAKAMLSNDKVAVYEEVIQVAAVALAIAQVINTGKPA